MSGLPRTGGERNSFRAFLADLEDRGELATIDAPVQAEGFDVSACLSALDGGPALLFTATGPSGIPVAGNMLNSFARIAAGLGVPAGDVTARVARAVSQPLAPTIASTAPAQEVVMAPDLAALPVPRFFEHETGPYLTAGCIAARDPVTGRGNLSFARLKPIAGDRALVGIAPNHHLAVLARAAAARGERLALAVTLGNHPCVLIAAALYLQLGEDELEIAGSLLGAPVEVVRCRTSGVLVPASCEIVIEGEIDPSETADEGPVSEYHGFYERYGAGHVMTVKAITRRRDAVLQVIEPGFHMEHVLIGGVAIAAGLENALRERIASLGRVAVPAGACGRLGAVVTLKKDRRPDDARAAIEAALAAVNLIKQVTVVDDDVDPWDALAVQHAIATCLRADRDIVVLPGMRTDRSEPMKSGGTIAKYGFVATRRDADRDDWTRAQPPRAAIERMATVLAAIRRGERRL